MSKKLAFALTGVSFVLTFFGVFLSNRTDAMPNFARKYDAKCSLCHTTIPRLNEVGYKFRAAGFRMPDEIGKEEKKKLDLADYFSGRVQARYDASRTRLGSTTSSTKNALTFHEVTIYPATGSWGKYYSSLFELSMLPEEPVEVENAFLRFNYGSENKFLTARVGIFHPFEGFGASDRPAAISRPFFQTNAANFNQSTFFTPWGFDEAGLEAGFDYKRTSVRATLFNGLVVRNEDGTIKAFASQGGVLNKANSLPAHNTPDFQFLANQILTVDGGNLSFYYYHGNLALPIAGNISNLFRNNFDRWAFYGSYPVGSHFHGLAGFQTGRDHTVTGTTFNSRGVFAEADVPLGQYATPGFRYDWFDPATNKDANEVKGVTAFVNVPLQNGVQAIAEYQHKNIKRGILPDRKDDAFQIRFIFIL